MVVDLFKTTEPQLDPLIGRKLDGRYDVISRLGEGGMGVVYKGRQAQLGRYVAIKVLHRDAAAIPEWRRRFEREARALSALAHPNVVPVTDSGIHDGMPFLVMELLQGKTLSELIKEGPLALARALDITRQILRGLAFAHGNSIVHRDLKPANVFLQELPDETDHVRLLDFGLAKFLDGSAGKSTADTLTRAGVVFGTATYMSPEQAKGGPADARTDVYTAGVLLFEMLTGRRPFEDPTYEGVIIEHLTKPVPSLAKVAPKLVKASLFQPLVEKAMAKKPAARFKDAGAMLEALEAVIAKLPAGAVREDARRKSVRARAVSAPSRWRFWFRAIVLMVAAGGIAAVATFVQHQLAARVEPAKRPKTARSSPPAKAVLLPPPPKSALPLPIPALPLPPSVAALPPRPELPAPPPAAPPAPPKQEAKPEAMPPAEKAQPPEAKAKQEAKTPAAPDASPKSRARNPWRGTVPRELKTLREKLERGTHLSQRALKPVYAYAHQNPGDPRPWLLLGRAYADLDWYSDSVERYERAFHEDATSRGDPQMLPDLLKAAAHPTAGRGAAKAIRDIYGAEAIPAVDKALRATADRDDTARLTRLRDSLGR